MVNHKLWNQLKDWNKNCIWVDLSHEVSPDTPHWVGWNSLKVNEKVNLNNSIFAAHEYTVVGQYGTHVDAPNHMVKGGRSLDQIQIKEMIMPMCIIDKEDSCKENVDYILTVQDIKDWETIYGTIPEGAFVVFKSGWSKRPPETMDNLDEQGKRHFPGWSKDAVEFLVHQRMIASIGHETSDTEAPITSEQSNYEVEYYILDQDRIQLEMLRNLDNCPAVGAIAFCTFPNMKNGTGFPARVFALCPKEE